MCPASFSWLHSSGFWAMKGRPYSLDRPLCAGTTLVKTSWGLAPRRRSPSDQTEMPKRLFDCLTFFGRARDDATTPTGAVRPTTRRYAPKNLDMSDPGGFRDEAVAALNELLYLAVGRHPSSSSLCAPALTPQPRGFPSG